MSTYWAILEKVRGSSLRLTKIDDEIYEHLKTDFPELDVSKTIDEEEMKSKSGKERWRKFMMAYEKKVDDYNFGTMLRVNPKLEYGNDETIFGRPSDQLPDVTQLTQSSSPHAILRYRDCEKPSGIERLDIRELPKGAGGGQSKGRHGRVINSASQIDQLYITIKNRLTRSLCAIF